MEEFINLEVSYTNMKDKSYGLIQSVLYFEPKGVSVQEYLDYVKKELDFGNLLGNPDKVTFYVLPNVSQDFANSSLISSEMIKYEGQTGVIYVLAGDVLDENNLKLIEKELEKNSDFKLFEYFSMSKGDDSFLKRGNLEKLLSNLA